MPDATYDESKGVIEIMKTQPTVIYWQPNPNQPVPEELRKLNLRVETITSDQRLLEKYDGTAPCCVIGDLAEFDRLRTFFQGRDPMPSLVLLTTQKSISTAVRALQAGATSVLELPCSSDDLQRQIQRGLATWEEAAARADFQRRIAMLSDQERRVLEYILEGHSNKEIATRLNVSLRTVESRRHNIFEKSRTKSLAELIRQCTLSRIGTSDGNGQLAAPTESEKGSVWAK